MSDETEALIEAADRALTAARQWRTYGEVPEFTALVAHTRALAARILAAKAPEGALPVLRTCRECGWCHGLLPAYAGEVRYSASPHCGNPQRKGDPRIVPSSAPPDWCPLRGGR